LNRCFAAGASTPCSTPHTQGGSFDEETGSFDEETGTRARFGSAQRKYTIRQGQSKKVSSSPEAKPETFCDFASVVEALSLSVPLAESSIATARRRTGTGRYYCAVLLTCLLVLALVRHQDTTRDTPQGNDSHDATVCAASAMPELTAGHQAAPQQPKRSVERPRSVARSFERLLAHHSMQFQPLALALVRYLPAQPHRASVSAESTPWAEDSPSEPSGDLLAVLFA
jgi:hypothetical protein